MVPDRRPPRDAPPAGYHYEVVEAHDGWVTPPIGAGRCRFGRPSCKAAPVATLMRGYPPRTVAWDYCADHLYGHWIEDGKVVGWRLVANDA